MVHRAENMDFIFVFREICIHNIQDVTEQIIKYLHEKILTFSIWHICDVWRSLGIGLWLVIMSKLRISGSSKAGQSSDAIVKLMFTTTKSETNNANWGMVLCSLFLLCLFISLKLPNWGNCNNKFNCNWTFFFCFINGYF